MEKTIQTEKNSFNMKNDFKAKNHSKVKKSPKRNKSDFFHSEAFSGKIISKRQNQAPEAEFARADLWAARAFSPVGGAGES